MKKTHIKDKLAELDFPVEMLCLGDFDMIGEFTAKKSRNPESDLYKKVGCFYRPNYERGLLIYSLIRKHKVSSYLEIGFGRGYSAFCASKAMDDAGIDGKVTCLDVKFDQELLKNLTRIFPASWFQRMQFVQGPSSETLDKIPGAPSKFDMIYIDGDHTYEGVRRDWELCKDRWNKVVLFDDYHLPTKSQKDIECAKLIDEIDDPSKELIIMDRRIFGDDRNTKDEEIDYGQVVMVK